jgi:two-component system, OmpR family, alkaline phosphatase synthesis response regulator PhoP
MRRILVVEDNPDLAFGLRNNLEIESYEVELAADGPAGLDLATRGRFDLIVLDLMIPGMDGFRVLRTLRERGNHTPVLILTARGQEEDKVRGLKLGADDYVTKPFGVLELMARVEALLRRMHPIAPRGDPARYGDIEVDPAGRIVRRKGAVVALAPKEFDLLWALIAAQGAVVSRDSLMERVWGYEADVLSRTVDTHVAEIRRKLEADPAAPRHIITVRKAGYRLDR